MFYESIRRCILFIYLLNYLLVIANEVLAVQSPCPNYFRYYWNDRREIMGQVIISSPPKYTNLHLKIEFSLAASLPSKYIGRLELARTKEETVIEIQQNRPIFYVVHFPVTQPLPILTNLWFNGQLYCSGPRASGRIVTSIVLEHTLFPPRALLTSANSNDDFDKLPNFNNFIPPFNQPEQSYSVPKPFQSLDLFQPSRELPPPSREPSPTRLTTLLPPLSTKPPPTRSPISQPPPKRLPISQPPPPLSSSFIPDNYEHCEQENILNKSSNPLIAAGVETEPYQWPWLVAIFVVKLNNEFLCAGTLVTNKHIITVAHCIKSNNIVLPPNTLMASLGRFYLWYDREIGSTIREIKKHAIHPDYKGGGKNDQTADADLAILTLREPVEYSKSIKPICLWTGSDDLRDIVGSVGYVIGWGKNEFGKITDEPRLAVVPIVSQEDCLWSNVNFINLTSNRTLCAGSRDGAGPCNGDSGSGLVIRRNDGRYYLRGAVSRSILEQKTKSCDLQNYIVYVDLTKYRDWIRLQISY